MKITKKSRLLGTVLWILSVFGLLLSVYAYFISPILMGVGCVLTAALILSAVLYEKHIRNLMLASYELAASRLSARDTEDLEKFPFPAAIGDQNGRILWNNRLFVTDVLAGKSAVDLSLNQIMQDIRPDFAERVTDCPVQVGDKEFTVFASGFRKNSAAYYTYYFVEDTEQKKLIRAYYATKPAVMLLYIDNLDDTVAGWKESEKVVALGRIETLLEKFMNATNGFMTKIERDRFLAVLEDRDMTEIIKNKFILLDEIRKASPAGQLPVTVSIGVGKGGADLSEDEKFARQALDMALGRGGDQAAVRTPDGYSFFGGVSKGVEKRSKIKTRIMASVIGELMENAGNILVMGHRSADLDCLGSATGMARAAIGAGKQAHVILRKSDNLAGSLLNLLEENGMGDLFITPEEGLRKVNDSTLLIITDTHGTASVESPEILDACKTVAVIDHHRKTVNFIEKAVIFYHEPFASSASEMVTELCQYIRQGECIGRVEAEALLAGIMLDTHNFTTQTGVRTFEAAAWLRSRGADTTEVKKLFTNTAEDYRERTAIVSSAEVKRGCGISVNPEEGPIAMMVSAQAADELLTLSGIRASFVFYRNDGVWGLSARSFGSVNVQLICEDLGGGGHQNMAGTRFAPEVTLEDARALLEQAIEAHLPDDESASKQ